MKNRGHQYVIKALGNFPLCLLLGEAELCLCELQVLYIQTFGGGIKVLCILLLMTSLHLSYTFVFVISLQNLSSHMPVLELFSYFCTLKYIQ